MIQPLSDNVALIPYPKESVSKGGIIIPDSAKPKEPLWKGRIVAVGPNLETEEPLLDKDVLYAAGAGTQIEDEGKLYLVMKEMHIAVIL